MVNRPLEDFELAVQCRHKWSSKHDGSDWRDGCLVVRWNENKEYHSFTILSKNNKLLFDEKLTERSLFRVPRSFGQCERTGSIEFTADYGDLYIEIRRTRTTYFKNFYKLYILLKDINEGKYEKFRTDWDRERRKRRYSDDDDDKYYIKRSNSQDKNSQNSDSPRTKNTNEDSHYIEKEAFDTRSPFKPLTTSNRPLDSDEPSPKKPKVENEISNYSKIPGFLNLGNSCYMNACIQALFGCPLFVKHLCNLYEDMEAQMDVHSLTWNLFRLYEEWQSGCVSCEMLTELKRVISLKSSLFDGAMQHDVHELLTLVLDVLKEEANSFQSNKPEKALSKPIQDTFEFQIMSKKTCEACSKEIKRAEGYMMLSLHLPSVPLGCQTSLQDALDGYFVPEKMDFTCEGCKYTTTCTAKDQFASLPRFLILHLKRYCYTEDFNSYKVASPLDIPPFITLKNYVSTDVQPLDIPSLSSQPSETDVPSVPSSFDETCGKIASGLKGGSYPNQVEEDNKENEQPHITDIPTIGPFFEDEEKALEEALKESIIDAEEKELQNAIQNSIEGSIEYEKPEENSIVPINNHLKGEHDLNLRTGHLANSYRLIGVVSHLGSSVDSGHYLCDIYDQKKGHWWHCNDELVSSRSLDEVLNFAKRFGYLFIYAAKETVN